MTTPLPDTDFRALDERSTLMGFLTYFRTVLIRKAEGLTEEQVRLAACPPSDLTLLGLVRHVADVERGWAIRTVAGRDIGPIFYGDAHPDGDIDGDFHPPADATMADALAALRAEIATADEIYAGADLDHIAGEGDRAHSVRWILVHMIEEYARHCGHADLLRQAIDGALDD